MRIKFFNCLARASRWQTNARELATLRCTRALQPPMLRVILTASLVALLLVPVPSYRGASISRRAALPGRRRVAGARLDGGALAALDGWIKSDPYESAFVITAFKATCSDLIAQWRERRAVAESVELDSSDPAYKVNLADAPAAGDFGATLISWEDPGEEGWTFSYKTIVDRDLQGLGLGFREEVRVPIYTRVVLSCDEIQCDERKVTEAAPLTLGQIVYPRTFAFFLYGGIYGGCAQYFIFNECYPVWFGEGTDLQTVAIKVKPPASHL